MTKCGVKMDICVLGQEHKASQTKLKLPVQLVQFTKYREYSLDYFACCSCRLLTSLWYYSEIRFPKPSLVLRFFQVFSHEHLPLRPFFLAVGRVDCTDSDFCVPAFARLTGSGDEYPKFSGCLITAANMASTSG